MLKELLFAFMFVTQILLVLITGFEFLYDIEILHRIKHPASIGIFLGAFTTFIIYRHWTKLKAIFDEQKRIK